jgi:zinc D-Ala-D-Ala carboxypeptidase
MVAAARAEVPELAEDLEALDVFSGFRSPAYDAARCAREGNCGGVTRAKCSPHRTGYTFDLVVGSAPGQAVDSSDDANRLHMTKTSAYRWLVDNGRRFGFVNYVFEPWHWEYRGAPIDGDPRELHAVAAR